jgi:hypothetical protein
MEVPNPAEELRTLTLRAEPLTAERFAPFGQVGGDGPLLLLLLLLRRRRRPPLPRPLPA